MQIENLSAQQAMDASSSEDRIVHLKWALGLEHDLIVDSDDSCRFGNTLEIWGHGWRVHLEGVPEDREGD